MSPNAMPRPTEPKGWPGAAGRSVWFSPSSRRAAGEATHGTRGERYPLILQPRRSVNRAPHGGEKSERWSHVASAMMTSGTALVRAVPVPSSVVTTRDSPFIDGTIILNSDVRGRDLDSRLTSARAVRCAQIVEQVKFSTLITILAAMD